MFTPQEATLLSELIHEKLSAKQGHTATTGGGVKEKTALVYASILAKLQQELPKQAGTHPARVLVVDDVESMRSLNIQLVKQIGFEKVEQASSGQKALQMIKQAQESGKPFGVILADWEMPNMTGLELLKEVRKTPEISHIPFYLLTSVTDKVHVINAIKNGVTGYLTKPFSFKNLHDKIKYFL